MSAPPSNVGCDWPFRLERTGALATCRVERGKLVGVFLYYQWDVVGVLTPDFGVGVQHEGLKSNCELHTLPDDSSTVYLRAKREIARGQKLSIDYRLAPWWVWPPPRPLVVPHKLLTTPACHVAYSPIHGQGLMASCPMSAGARVGTAIRFHWLVLPVVTRELGRHINHSSTPTCELRSDGGWTDCWDWEVVVTRPSGLRHGDEITLDYTKLPWYCRGVPKVHSSLE